MQAAKPSAPGCCHVEEFTYLSVSQKENSTIDIAKIQIKSEKLTPFDGIFSIIDDKTEYIDHIQVKTKDRVTIPLSEETKKWMPEREKGIDNIFHNLKITSTTVEVVLKE